MVPPHRRAGGGLEPAGRALEPAGRASEPAGRTLKPAGRALEPAGRVTGDFFWSDIELVDCGPGND